MRRLRQAAASGTTRPRHSPAPAVIDEAFQHALLAQLARLTGVALA